MYNIRELVLAITAIFIALALGILIGVSFGDDYLVASQREVIELMERELLRLSRQVAEQAEGLARYREIEPLALARYREYLAGRSAFILAGPEQREAAEEIRRLLESNGAGAAVAQVLESGAKSEEPAPSVGTAPPWLPAELHELEIVVDGELMGAGIPDYLIVLFAREGEEDALHSFQPVLQYWRELEKPVVAVAAWEQDAPPFAPPGKLNKRLVDNINTFWGRLALLEILAYDCGGDYGFDAGRAGLMPSLVPGRSEER